MNYNDRINKLADLFEYKLKKYAADLPGEVNSKKVTEAVESVSKAVFDLMDYHGTFSKIVKLITDKNQAIADQKKKKPNDIEYITGNYDVHNFITNAKMENGKWVVDPNTSELVLTGTLLDDSYAGPLIKNYVQKLNQAIIRGLTVRFTDNTANGYFQGGSLITRNDTNVSKSDANIG